MREDPRGRVLVVDDDDLVGGMLVAHARSLGFEATATADPESFLRLAKELRPQFVIVDLVMGALDGIAVLKQLSLQGCQATVIITSGAATNLIDAARTFTIESGLNYGGALPKPFRRGDVAAVLDRAIESTPHAKDPAADFARQSYLGFSVELRKAIQDRRIVPYLQPKIACRDGRVVGAEALARWTHPVLGPVSPAVFVPYVEEIGLVSHLTDLIARTGTTWLAGAAVDDDFRLSLNISGSELADATLGKRLLAVCTAAGVAPRRIMLEVTETSTVDDAVGSLEVLTRLGLEGFGLSVDDFGTGYSSVQQLARLPFSELKVDRSFVDGIVRSERSATVVRSMVALASGLELTSIAEGVETSEQFRMVSDMGCTTVQGFYVARPMPIAEFDAWLRRWDEGEREAFMAAHAPPGSSDDV